MSLDLFIERPVKLPRNLHYMTVRIPGLEVKFECRHEEFPDRYHCGYDLLMDYDFWDCFDGPEGTPLHEGLIEHNWVGYEGEDITWRYVE